MAKIGHLAKAIQPLQNTHFGSKIKTVKNIPKTTLEPHQSCSLQKAALKTPNIRKMTTFPKWPKIGHHAKAIDFAKSLLFSKIKIVTKKSEKQLYNHIRVVMCKKTAPKNTQYSKYDNSSKVAKIGKHPKVLPIAKSSVCDKN